ncbi:MAG: hypothetical protein QF535_23095 [Anaerolineales bacterium]|nr:hypothetical protein [Anaerolineales bacterium]
MKYLTDITEEHVATIRMCMNDVQNEYDPDRSLQLRVYSISQKLSENISMYQLSSEELDIVCMCMNDSLCILDELRLDVDLSDAEKREAQEYSEDISAILRVLQRN